jgi:hypothetical protein
MTYFNRWLFEWNDREHDGVKSIKFVVLLVLNPLAIVTVSLPMVSWLSKALAGCSVAGLGADLLRPTGT